jgi:hypothetical protein
MPWVWWFNEIRLHSEIGYRTPIEFEQDHYRQINSQPQPRLGEPSPYQARGGSEWLSQLFVECLLELGDVEAEDALEIGTFDDDAVGEVKLELLRCRLVFWPERIPDCVAILPELGQIRDRSVRVTDGDATGFGIQETWYEGAWPEFGLVDDGGEQPSTK